MNISIWIAITSCLVVVVTSQGYFDTENERGYGRRRRTTTTTTTRAPTTTPCRGFVCAKTGKCVPNDARCDGNVDCTVGYRPDNSDELDCTIPHCCDDELVLNFTTIGTLFSVALIDNAQCGNASLVPANVTNAFRGSGRKLRTNCTAYEIVVTVTAPTLASAWDICYVAYKTEYVEQSNITVDRVEFTHTESTVNQLVNQTGSGVIGIHVKAQADSHGRCLHETSISNIQITVCRRQPDTTTPVMTTAEMTTVDTRSRDCLLTDVFIPRNTTVPNTISICRLQQDVTVKSCNGACVSISSSGAQFTNATGFPPTQYSQIPLDKDCKCCDGLSTWTHHPVICTDSTGNVDVASYAIATMTSCDCLACVDLGSTLGSIVK